MIHINNAKKILMGIISCNDSLEPLYTELSNIVKLPYDETKQKVKKDIVDYIDKLYEFQKIIYNERTSYHHFLIKNETAIETLNYILKIYGKNGHFQKLINIIREF
ncbi:MAG TPA: hypothetical protein PLC43_03970 [Caldisericia bacterium]|nr:hypothetical protein [Caldisericia bacterium]